MNWLAVESDVGQQARPHLSLCRLLYIAAPRLQDRTREAARDL